ncbi:DNA-processing protein DprA [Paludibacter jiangxiensis]|nr:DNA-processing protein DprA [Paludibacter jiangxiensis]
MDITSSAEKKKITVISDMRYLIALSMIKGIGPILARNLIAYLGAAEAVFTETQQNLEKIPGIGGVLSQAIIGKTDLLKSADNELEFIAKNGFNAFAYTDKTYPFRLKECSDAPVVLYTNGNIDLNKGRFVAVVGTRNITDYGRNVCETLIEDLVLQIPDVIIVSGLAYGADITAHKSALKHNTPTVGVVAHGLDRLYPAAHTSIASKMTASGAIVTEYTTNTEPDKPNFVQRNRIIAGMCDAIVVVESAIRGGSLLTADAANLYNREVFAIPGRVGDTRSAGCNDLIRQNKAALIESASDLIKAMSWQPNESKNSKQTLLFNDLSEEEQTIISVLRQHESLQINQLTLKLKLPVEKLFPLLIELEFKGHLRCLPGNVYKVVG